MKKLHLLLFFIIFFVSFAYLGALTSEVQKKDQAEKSQEITSATHKKTKRVAAGVRYQASALHRFLLGSEYRQLWAVPIDAEILDLKTTAGGLTPVMRVGGMQTKGLALRGQDGRSYTFRGTDKDPTSVLPPDLQGTIADRIVQDQISSAHPAAPVIAGPIQEAAGILHTKVRLVLMPDDEALGKFRDEFAGLLGTFEEYPTPVSDDNPGFAGATEILDHQEMWHRIQAAASDRIDTRAFLKTRLVDLFIGDWDRHRRQWRWAKIPGKSRWQPIPEDRDQAFCRYDGVIVGIARNSLPRIVKFGDNYPTILGLTFNGWSQDRYFLTDLEWEDWKEIAEDLKISLTDAVIETAVRGLPSEYLLIDGKRLETSLKVRRDNLLDVTKRYYRHLAHKVDIHATDMSELAEIFRIDDSTIEVRISLLLNKENEPKPKAYYSRRLHSPETQEIRLYLHGGDDMVVTKGGRFDSFKIRIIGGSGNDSIDDSAGGGLKVYDSEGTPDVTPSSGTKLSTRKYDPPINPYVPWLPPRDWGRQTVPIPWFGGGPDIGIFIGGGFTDKTFGFRKLPYSSAQTIRFGYASGANTFRLDYHGDFHKENSGRYTTLSALASRIELLRFFGYGNETQSDEGRDFYKVEQQQYSFHLTHTVPLVGSLSLTMGPIIKFSKTEPGQYRLIHIINPYGTENYGQVGIYGRLFFDTRNRLQAATRGVLLSLIGQYFPGIWDVKSAFGMIHSEASAFLTASAAPFQPTLAFRAGGKRVFGTYPFHEAASIGGGGLAGSHATVRGLYAQRFIGDSALYGNAELRLRLSKIYLFLPGEMGIFGLSDVGRVFLSGEKSNKWHTAYGGGIWVSLLRRDYTFSLTVAQSEERMAIYLSGGFLF